MFQEKYFFGQVKLSNTVQIISLLYSTIQEWVTSPGVKKTLELHLAQVLKKLTSSRESFHRETILLWKEMKVRCNNVQEISFKMSSPHLDTPRVVSSQRQLTIQRQLIVQRPGLFCYHHFPEVSLILHFTGWGVLAIELLVSNPQERPQTQAPSGWGVSKHFPKVTRKLVSSVLWIAMPSQLCHYDGAAIDTKEHVCVPIKFYLHKQMKGQICPVIYSWPSLT